MAIDTPHHNHDHRHHHHHMRPPSPPTAQRPVILIDDEDDISAYSPRRGSNKRKVVDLTHSSDDCCEAPVKKSKTFKKNDKSEKKEPSEKRLRRFRSHAPGSFTAILERAISQRMFVLERKKTGTASQPEETIELAGSTGNVYTIVINNAPSCNCPHAKKGNQCKHIVYILKRTLKAPAHLQYQLAFLTSELHEIFAKALPLPSEKVDDNSGNRKPVEDECPICCVEFDTKHDNIVWCRAACGNNIHKACFEQWAAQKRVSGGGVTCPFCRSQWEGDQDIKKVKGMAGKVGADGYVNVANELGLSGVRDYSSYHPFWVRRQQQAGLIPQDDYDYYGHED